MEKTSFFCDKEITEILKKMIEKKHSEYSLRIVKIEDDAEYKDMSRFIIEYSNPWFLIELGEDIVISRLTKIGII